MLERDELGAWLRLLLTPGLGRSTARALLARFGLPVSIFETGAGALLEVVGPALADAMASEPAALAEQQDLAQAWLAADPARTIVTLADAEYPRALLETADPPLLLYLHGRVELLSSPSIAIVGSRNPTAQGEDNARAFAAHLSGAGFTVVSGLALGIDGAAHEGALTGAGSTIAVVGTGLDIVYPRRHHDLAHRIGQRGLLVSEYTLGTPSMAQNFPLRNRIIAGLTRGTLVVEAALQSGSLITARLAAEAGRDVFAVPGSIHSPQSRGCHALIKQGAKLVDGAQDVLEEWQSSSAAVHPVPTAPPAAAEDPLLKALGHDPATLDTLVGRTGWPASDLNARLLELELDGKVARMPGGLFQRRMQT